MQNLLRQFSIARQAVSGAGMLCDYQLLRLNRKKNQLGAIVDCVLLHQRLFYLLEISLALRFLKYLKINFDSGFGYIQGTLLDILNLNLKSLKPIYVLRNYYSSNINVLNLYLDQYYVYDDIDDIDNKSSIFAEFGSKLLY
jgi:hypothetical protein